MITAGADRCARIGQTAHINRDCAFTEHAKPELTGLVRSPAENRAVAGQRTGVGLRLIAAGRDTGDASRQGRHPGGVGVVCKGSVPQLAIVIAPPARNPTTGDMGARVLQARGQGDNPAAKPDDGYRYGV
jgi:hypothetical protein